jgi:hypothetical protein
MPNGFEIVYNIDEVWHYSWQIKKKPRIVFVFSNLNTYISLLMPFFISKLDYKNKINFNETK